MTRHETTTHTRDTSGTSETTGTTAGADRRWPMASRTSTFLTLVAGSWLVVSTFVLAHPFTVDGVDARQRELALGLVVAVLALARLRAPRHTWRSSAGLVVAALVLITMPAVFGYGPTGDLAVAWWNEILTGVVVLATTVLGLVSAALDRQGRSEREAA